MMMTKHFRLLLTGLVELFFLFPIPDALISITHIGTSLLWTFKMHMSAFEIIVLLVHLIKSV